MYSHAMLILINQCLLNVVFCIAKVLDGQSSPEVLPTFLLSSSSNTIWKTLFHTLIFFFFFKAYKFSTDPLQVWTLWLVC